MCKNEFQFGLGVSVPASTLEWAHRFSGKGWWLAQPTSPSPRRCFSGKWGPISQGMTLPRAHLFCFFFAFVLFFLLFCFFFAFLLFFFAFYLGFLRFLSKSIQFWRSPIRIGDLPFRLATCPLGRREPRHCAFFGFTGSPRTSLFKFNVSFVFCAGFTTLSRLICCFPVCCIWHFPFSLVAFHLSIFSTYHVASFQLALVPCMCSSFVKCAPFQVPFALSMFHPFAIFASFQLAFCFPIFSAIVMCASFRFACSNSIFGIVSPFFQDVNILEQAQFDSTNVQTPCKLQQLPPDRLFDPSPAAPSLLLPSTDGAADDAERLALAPRGTGLLGFRFCCSPKMGNALKKKENINCSTIKLAIPNFRET